SEKSSEKSSEKILRVIGEQPDISAKVLADRLGITSRAVEKQIARLKAEGKLIRIGPAKGGHWEVKGRVKP
ncbi:MAG: winged helix-turn-helix transcriptional regulator, partial [Deltaproteobacteria bacterium]|nr:winged helix-turn-helix transcriptional regulator [Deltaproteobacteria bacterium]